MRQILTLALLGWLGCGGGDDTSALDDLGLIVRVNDASDEILLQLDDLVLQGRAIVDDTRVEHLETPASGAQVPAADPPFITWSLPAARPRHGVTTGNFTWLRFTGPGLADPIDMIAVDRSSWTPDPATWVAITHATGAVTVTVTTAYVDGGNVLEGPFRGTSNTSFTVIH